MQRISVPYVNVIGVEDGPAYLGHSRTDYRPSWGELQPTQMRIAHQLDVGLAPEKRWDIERASYQRYKCSSAYGGT